ncbi:MAG: MFS transporter [Neisseriaceae bacterium]|nr:MFS transporter [Neisseriaceae bacterium]
MNTATTKQQKYLPWIMAAAVFMQMLDATILNTALPAMAQDLGVSPLNMQMAIIAYALTLALFMPLGGSLADRFGTKRIFMPAVILFGIGSILCASATSLNQLIFYRIIQATGGALMTPIARLALIRSFEKSQWLNVLTFAVTPALLGPLIGPILGGYLTVLASWHWIFLINIPIVILGLWFSYHYFPNCYGEQKSIDWIGYVLFALFAFLITLGLDLIGRANKIIYLSCLLLGIIFLLFYFLYARKKDNAIFPISLFSVRTFRIGFMGNLCSRIGISSMPILLPLLFQVGFGVSPDIAGWLLAPIAAASMLTKFVISKIINYFGYRTVLISNTILIGLCIASFALPPTNTLIILFVPMLFLMGLLNSVQFSSMNTIVLADLKPEQSSSGNTLHAINQQLSISFGLAAGMSLLRLVQDMLPENNVHTAFRITFIVLGLITAISAFIFSRLHKTDGIHLMRKK